MIYLRHSCTVPKEFDICCTYVWIKRMTSPKVKLFLSPRNSLGKDHIGECKKSNWSKEGLREKLVEVNHYAIHRKIVSMFE